MGESLLDLVRPTGSTRSLERLRVGFIPLVDCAPLIVARDLGFAEEEGLSLDLVREASWANIRDRIVLGHFDAAHLLAPMPIAIRLGIGHLEAPIVVPWVLNHGGNSIAVSAALRAAASDWGGLEDPAAVGATLRLLGRPTSPGGPGRTRIFRVAAADALSPDRQPVLAPPPTHPFLDRQLLQSAVELTLRLDVFLDGRLVESWDDAALHPDHPAPCPVCSAGAAPAKPCARRASICPIPKIPPPKPTVCGATATIPGVPNTCAQAHCCATSG